MGDADDSKQPLSGKRRGYSTNPIPVLVWNGAIGILHALLLIGFVACLIVGSVMVSHSNACRRGHHDYTWTCEDPFPEVMGPRFFAVAVLIAVSVLGRYAWAIQQAKLHYDSHAGPYNPCHVIQAYYCGLAADPEYVNDYSNV